MNSKYYLYHHMRPDKNEVFYVGIGKESTKRSMSTSGRNKHWHNVINLNQNKYTIEIIFNNLSKEEATQKEIELIKFYGRIGYEENGTLVNVLKGGQLQDIGPNYKKIWSEEVKKKMSLGHIGNPSLTGKVSITNGIKSTFINKDAIIPEGLYLGGPKKGKRSQEFKDKCSKNKAGKKLNLSPEQLKCKSDKMLGNKGSSNKYWIHNFIESKYINVEQPIPDGWVKGRIRTWVNQYKK